MNIFVNIFQHHSSTFFHNIQIFSLLSFSMHFDHMNGSSDADNSSMELVH